MYIDNLDDRATDRLNYNDFAPINRRANEWVRDLFIRLGLQRNINDRQPQLELEMADPANEQPIREGWLRSVERMNNIEFSQEEVKRHLSKLKDGKQPGIDGIKPEFFKWLSESRTSITSITSSFNKIVNDRSIPENWKKSKTVLVPKKARPTKSELRPICLNGVSYKLFMSLAKCKT